MDGFAEPLERLRLLFDAYRILCDRQPPPRMHEPFFTDYIDDLLEDILGEPGLTVEATERAWLSKVVVAREPETSDTQVTSGGTIRQVT